MAYLLTLLVKNKSSMLIWDVYPDAFKVTGMSEKNKIYKLWVQADRRVFERAYRLFTIGNRMKELLSVYVPPEKITVMPLWSIFDGTEKINKNSNPFIKQENLQDKFVVQYSGNIGLTHNVELVIELAELLKENNRILFQIIGKGLRVPYLKKLTEEKNLKNCQFLPFQTDETFPLSLSAANLGIVILDDRTSKGSIPSKTYNLMSFGIPILYLASEDSELHDYSIKYFNGKLFNRLALEGAAEFIQQLASDDNLYKELSNNSALAAKNFTRINADQIVEEYFF